MELLAPLARLLAYLGVTLVVGGPTLRFLLGRDDAGRAVAQRRATGTAWMMLGVSVLLQLVLQARALELEMAAAPIGELLLGTTWGTGWCLLAAAVMLGALGFALRWGNGFAASTALLVAIAMGGLGHAAAEMEWPITARLLDAAHLVAVGAWLGALFFLWRSVRPVDQRVAWQGFSRMAVVAAPLALLTGVGASLLRLRASGLGDALASDYGRLLLLKVALALTVLAIGATHRRRIASGRAPVVAGVRVELLVALAVFAVTSVLTGTAPPGE